MQEPARRRPFMSIEAFAIEPGPHSALALDPEIIARQHAALLVAPPFHCDALGPFRMRHLMQHLPPAKPYRRPIRHLRHRLDQLGPEKQTYWTCWSHGIR